MTENTFVRAGHGYASGSRGRCDAFDGFEIIAAPLHQEGYGWDAAFGAEARASRIYRRANGNGTDYGSHAIMLAKKPPDNALFILMHHGAGREVWRIPAFYDGGTLAEHIATLPERLQYSLLYTMWKMARASREQGQAETGAKWADAFASKRIRRRKGRIEIIPQWEVDARATAKQEGRANG